MPHFFCSHCKSYHCVHQSPVPSRPSSAPARTSSAWSFESLSAALPSSESPSFSSQSPLILSPPGNHALTRPIPLRPQTESAVSPFIAPPPAHLTYAPAASPGMYRDMASRDTSMAMDSENFSDLMGVMHPVFPAGGVRLRVAPPVGQYHERAFERKRKRSPSPETRNVSTGYSAKPKHT